MILCYSEITDIITRNGLNSADSIISLLVPITESATRAVRAGDAYLVLRTEALTWVSADRQQPVGCAQRTDKAPRLVCGTWGTSLRSSARLANRRQTPRRWSPNSPRCPSILLQYSAFAVGDHGSGSTMLTCRSFSAVARPGAAISFIVRTTRSFMIARSKTARLVCPLSHDG